MASHKHQRNPYYFVLRLGASVVVSLLLLVQISGFLFHAEAALLDSRSLTLSSGAAGATNVNYSFDFTIGTASTLGSILFQLCSNDPFPLTACTAPAGLDASSATLSNQSGETGFIIDTASPNTLLISRTPAAAALTQVAYEFSGVTNPSTSGTYYVRIITYASDDGSGPATDVGGIAWAVTSGVAVTSEVPLNLEFCVAITIPALSCSGAAGSSIDFGNFSTSSTSTGTSQFLVFSNAGFGFAVTLYGQTMTSGSYTIPALATQSFAAAGNSQFGLNLRDNASPNVGTDPVGPGAAVVDANYASPDLYRFVSGDVVVSAPGVSDYRKFTASYIVNVNAGQRPGVYVTTMNYICLANY